MQTKDISSSEIFECEYFNNTDQISCKLYNRFTTLDQCARCIAKSKEIEVIEYPVARRIRLR
jgi:hypothetical protein